MALRPWLEGRCLRSFEPRRAGLRRPFPPEAAAIVVGRTIRRVERRAKFLLFDLGWPWVLLMHLGMTGHLRLCPAAEPADPHDHLVCRLDGGMHLRFTDPRRFGVVDLFRRTRAAPWPPELARLGPEPLGPEFTVDRLAEALHRRSGPIKNVLLDQRVVAGLGNIYAAEALFLARIHPATPAARLSDRQIEALHQAIRETLQRAIAAGSTVPPEVPPAPAAPAVPPAPSGSDASATRATARSRRRAGASPRASAGQAPPRRGARPSPAPEPAIDRSHTYFPFAFAVYGREGQPCPRCRTGRVARLVQVGRSTFFCPRCQPAGRSPERSVPHSPRKPSPRPGRSTSGTTSCPASSRSGRGPLRRRQGRPLATPGGIV